MATSNLNAILQAATLQVINNTNGQTQVNSSAQNPTLGCSTTYYNNYYEVVSGSGSVINIPLNTAWVVWVRNLGGMNGTPSGNITVQFTVTGGTQISTTNAPVLPPGGIFSYWCTSEITGGITALTLVASTNATPVEILLAS